jgi:Flp pilus assembly protein TadG
MSLRSANERPRRGVAAVELAVLLPMICILLLGLWEVGRMVEMQQLLTNAAREGARQAVTGNTTMTNAAVQQVVTQYLSEAGLPTQNCIVTVTDLTNPALDVSQAQYLDRIQVTVSIPYQDCQWCVLSLVTTSGERVQAQAEWVTTVDKPYPIPPEPPVG